MSGSRMDTARTTNLAVKAAVQQIAPKFFFDPLTTARGAELGYDGLQFYIAGRGGVIGDASDDIVVDAFHYFEPGTIAAMWAAAAKIGTASDAAAAYAECCHAWGRAKLADFDGVDRLAEIAGRIAGANDLGATGRLSSGWRAAPGRRRRPGRGDAPPADAPPSSAPTCTRSRCARTASRRWRRRSASARTKA
ncbi:helix-turn-helix domain-containing protein [Yinghuangia aomiensis]